MNTPSQVLHVGPLAPYMASYQSVLEASGYKPARWGPGSSRSSPRRASWRAPPTT
jgi:hypothetical protein